MSNAFKLVMSAGTALIFFALAAAGLYLPGPTVTRDDSGKVFITFLDHRIPRLVTLHLLFKDVPRLVQAGISVAMLTGLEWCAVQTDLFILSVFPAAAL